MICIELVRVGDVLVGRTVSDRWNLFQLICVASIADDRNGTALKRLRRASGADFTLTKVRGKEPVWKATPAELQALGTVNAESLTAAA